MGEEFRENEKNDMEPKGQEEAAKPLEGQALHRGGGRDLKGPKRWIIAGAVLAVICLAVALLYFLPQSSAPRETAPPRSIYLVNAEKEDLAQIKLQNSEEFTVSYDPETGLYSAQGVPQELLEQDIGLSLYTNVTRMFVDNVAANEAATPALYGFDAPRAKMTLVFTDGTERVFLLGAKVPVSSQHYLMEEGKPEVYLAQDVLATRMLNVRNDYYSLRLPETSVEDGKSLLIRQRGGENWRIARRDGTQIASSNGWHLEEPYDLDVGYEAVYELINGIGAVTLDRYLGKVSAEEITAYGLDDPYLTLEFVDPNGQTRHFELGDKNEDGKFYLRLKAGSNDVYLAGASQFAFAENLDLRTLLDQFASIINITQTDEIRVSGGGKSYTLRIGSKEQFDEEGKLKLLQNGEPDYAYTYSINGKTVEEKAFKTAYQAIIGVVIVDFAEEAKLDESAAPVLTVDFSLLTGEEELLVEYLPYDINNYAVRRAGLTLQVARKSSVDAILPALESLYSSPSPTPQ
ncbi:MAG: DUF4340 domain-containing protein [Christensenellaceae bacterium]|jgi:hypothetical protein|nr:DUF4340 domain-containing protein [Christensenellaceae bacterium]